MHLLIVGKFPPIQGGVSANSYWLAQEMVATGHKVTVVTNALDVEDQARCYLDASDVDHLSDFSSGLRYSSTYSPRHHFIPTPGGTLGFAELLGIAESAILADRPDVIFVNYLEPYVLIAEICSSRHHIPFVVAHAGSDLFYLCDDPVLSASYLGAMRRASAVITTPPAAALISSRSSASDFHFVNSPGAVVPANFTPLFSTRGEAPEDGAETVTVMMAGKLDPSKQIPAVAAGISIAQDGGASMVLHILAPRARQRYLHKMLLESFPSVKFKLDDLAAPWKMPMLLHRSDVVCCLEHGFGLAVHSGRLLLEALCAGSTCLVSGEVLRSVFGPASIDSSISDQLIEVSEPNSNDAIAAALASVAKNISCTRADGLGARRFIGVDRVVPRYLEIFTEATDR